MSPAERNRINRLIKRLKNMPVLDRVDFLKRLGYDVYGKDADLAKYLDVFDEKEKRGKSALLIDEVPVHL